MKIGVDAGPLSEVDAKLVRAAAIAHEATGLPMPSTPATASPRSRRWDLLERAGVPLSAFIWVHAQANGRRAAPESRGARRVGRVRRHSPESVDRHVARGGDARGRAPRPRPGVTRRRLVPRRRTERRRVPRLDTLFTMFVPALKAAGVTDADVRQLLVDNPRRALTPRS